MITGELTSKATTDWEGYATFDLTVSRGMLQARVSFWGYSDLLEQFGTALAVFPQKHDDTVEIGIGRDAPGVSRSYLLLRAYCYDANGHAALKIVTHNNENEPEAQRVEFSIPADSAAFNKLGRLLKNWRPQESAELVWQAQVS